MQRRNLLSLAAAAACSALLLGTAGCSDKAADENRIRVGVTAGPHADIVTKAAEVAKQKGLTVEVVEFTDEERQAFADACHEQVWPKLAQTFTQEFLDGVLNSAKAN